MDFTVLSDLKVVSLRVVSQVDCLVNSQVRRGLVLRHLRRQEVVDRMIMSSSSLFVMPSVFT